MKLLISMIGIFFVTSLAQVDAKEVDYIFDQNKQTFECHGEMILSSSIRKIRLENIGSRPVKEIFPLISNHQCLTLNDLADWLIDEKYPLLSLYHLWTTHVANVNNIDPIGLHPFEILNYHGYCSTTEYEQQFLNLCQALGIKIRKANVKRKAVYDFSIEKNEWMCLDLATGQIYLALDNMTLASSEDVMDDPFLALRTKHGAISESLDLNRTCLELARFEIVEPATPEDLLLSVSLPHQHKIGYELYPSETVIFEAIEGAEGVKQYSSQHQVNLMERHSGHRWVYHSPVPLNYVVNNTSVVLTLNDLNTFIKPGNRYYFDNLQTYSVELSVEEDTGGSLLFSGIISEALFPKYLQEGFDIRLNTPQNDSVVKWTFVTDEDKLPSHPLTIKVEDTYPITFSLSPVGENDIEAIWWQISRTPDFVLVPSNFNQIEVYQSLIAFPLINDTFFAPGISYYIRVKALINGVWSEWTIPQSFVVDKPFAVEEVEFEKIDDHLFEFNWERMAEETDDEIEYLIFGSNALDFIPSIYCSTQINGIVNRDVIDDEINENLVAVTRVPKVQLNGGYAYYRIIARVRTGNNQGRLSVPSEIIHLYDEEVIQPRNVLQISSNEEADFTIVKRLLIPLQYPWMEVALPHTNVDSKNRISDSLIQIQQLLRAKHQLEVHEFVYNKKVSPDVWEECKSYFLPANHPAIPKLNRLFSASRVTKSPESCKKAGFSRWRPGRYSRVLASSHPDLKEYFLKIYCDNELGIKYDYLRWIHRIQGANLIRDCIKRHNYEKMYSVPRKYIYPLPEHPSCPSGPQYLPKHFILVCDNMRILDHSKNEKKYKTAINVKMLRAMYTIFQECGLYDSTFCFNCPFCKDGRIAIIDTEYWHRWPVPFQRMTHYFSKEMQREWEKIYKAKPIPDGETKPWIPRQDRRDR